MSLSGYTDYPFSAEEFGRGTDTPRQQAPIRAIEVLTWDRNKYVDVRVAGLEGTFNIKYGYCYREEGRCGDVPTFTFEELETLPRCLPEDEPEAPSI